MTYVLFCNITSKHWQIYFKGVNESVPWCLSWAIKLLRAELRLIFSILQRNFTWRLLWQVFMMMTVPSSLFFQTSALLLHLLSSRTQLLKGVVQTRYCRHQQMWHWGRVLRRVWISDPLTTPSSKVTHPQSPKNTGKRAAGPDGLSPWVSSRGSVHLVQSVKELDWSCRNWLDRPMLCWAAFSLVFLGTVWRWGEKAPRGLDIAALWPMELSRISPTSKAIRRHCKELLFSSRAGHVPLKNSKPVLDKGESVEHWVLWYYISVVGVTVVAMPGWRAAGLWSPRATSHFCSFTASHKWISE